MELANHTGYFGEHDYPVKLSKFSYVSFQPSASRKFKRILFIFAHFVERDYLVRLSTFSGVICLSLASSEVENVLHCTFVWTAEIVNNPNHIHRLSLLSLFLSTSTLLFPTLYSPFSFSVMCKLSCLL